MTDSTPEPLAVPSTRPAPGPTSRREFLVRNAMGIGAVALTSLLEKDGLLAREEFQHRRTVDLSPREPHFAPRAQAMILPSTSRSAATLTASAESWLTTDGVRSMAAEITPAS